VGNRIPLITETYSTLSLCLPPPTLWNSARRNSLWTKGQNICS